MNSKFKNILRNLIYTFGANGISLLVAMMMTLFVPKQLGVKSYAYWQLYSFYVSYIGFFHFGWIDGVYLKLGGRDISELNRKLYITQFWYLSVFELLIGVVISIFALSYIVDINKKIIIIITCINGVVITATTFFLYILQATNCIKDYARLIRIDRYIYFTAVMTALLVGVNNYQVLLVIDLVSKVITLLQCIRFCRSITFGELIPFGEVVLEIYDNMESGFKLMLSNVAGMLVIGIIRLGIEHNWDVITFGKISFTISISNLLMIFINSLSIIMFPALRCTSEERLPQLYSLLRSLLMVPLLGLLLFYFPIRTVLVLWLPQYADSLVYTVLLLPVCIYEGKMVMLINTYLKTLRKEQWILATNIITVILSVITTLITVFALNNLHLAVLSIFLLLALKTTLAEYLLTNLLKLNILTDSILEFALTIIFVLSSWYIGGWGSFLIYLLSYIWYLVFKRKNINEIVSLLYLLIKPSNEELLKR